MRDAFIGYPGEPKELTENLDAGIEIFRKWRTATVIRPWTELSGPSTPIIYDVLKTIRECEVSFFDVTVPNQNVFYEIGYSAGLGKAIFLLLNDAFKDALHVQIELGIFDTHRLKRYRNGIDLANILRDAREPYHQTPPGIQVNVRQPLYFQHHFAKTQFPTTYFASVKQQQMGLRTYDPEEDLRLPLDRAHREITTSAGVFLSLISDNIVKSEQHNLKAFLLAGIADACGIPRLLLKFGQFTPAFDLRDGVVVVKDRSDIRAAVQNLLPQIHERQQQMHVPAQPIARSHLMNLSLGATAAENELHSLDLYFLETREFRRALKGEAKLVIGRKGVGKTAIFWQVRNRMRANRGNLVLDLRPEGYQLRKLSEIIADNFSEATHSHTMTIFWEYVLYLELCHKILNDDREIYARDSRLVDIFSNVRDAYENVDEFREGDFPERLLMLINRLRQDVRPELVGDSTKILTTPQITELIYRTDFQKLRDTILEYIAHKQHTLILVDNLDSGWTTSGVNSNDIKIVQCLIDAGRKVERAAQKHDADVSITVFLRDDVYDWLIADASDRGKDSTIRVLWREPSLLRRLVDRRLEAASSDLGISPVLEWSTLAKGKIDGEEIFDFLVRHCLRRPRSLLDLVELCLSNATLAGRTEIIPEDARHAVDNYSRDMLRDLNYEIRDVFPEADKIIYDFAKESTRLDQRSVERIANRKLRNQERGVRFVHMLLWFGFFGVVNPDGTEDYVFDHGDDIDLLLAHARRGQNPILTIHPLFRSALSTRSDLLF